uniref:Uncharacterized protein LOC105125466 n=1 Tax=Rhizophora mucronata TaxID=61149 RepID=A0A2P2KS50_RHIMU
MVALSPLFLTTAPSISKAFTSSSVRVPDFMRRKKHKCSVSLSSFQSSLIFAVCLSTTRRQAATSTTSTSTPFTSASSSSDGSGNNHWMVVTDGPPLGVNSQPEIIDYYVKTLARVLGSEEDAQTCIYDVSCDTPFGFCCNVNEEASSALASLPGVSTVRPDPDCNSKIKDYSLGVKSSDLLTPQIGSTLLFPAENTKHWLVRIDKPGVGVVTKAQMVDYYAQILTKVLGNEKDAQMCIYHVSWQSNFGFCCVLDEECAHELVGVAGVLSVKPDKNSLSENKDYKGDNLENPDNVGESLEAIQTTPMKTKKLFITGLSFYTSEKTLRAAFEGFGELVEGTLCISQRGNTKHFFISPLSRC